MHDTFLERYVIPRMSAARFFQTFFGQNVIFGLFDLSASEHISLMLTCSCHLAIAEWPPIVEMLPAIF